MSDKQDAISDVDRAMGKIGIVVVLMYVCGLAIESVYQYFKSTPEVVEYTFSVPMSLDFFWGMVVGVVGLLAVMYHFRGLIWGDSDE